MQVRIDKRFWKQYEKLDTPTKELVLEQLEKCQQAVSFQDIQGLKMLKGSKKDYYRIRLGHFRMGFVFENQELCFDRIAFRKEFYDGYPPKK